MQWGSYRKMKSSVALKAFQGSASMTQCLHCQIRKYIFFDAWKLEPTMDTMRI